MKKIALVFISFCFIHILQAQTWNLTLNTISGNPNFGTANNKPIDFFTNNTLRMSLTPTGTLKINGLAGTGSRFLQADANGVLTPWVGSLLNKDYVLYGDGSWKLPPIQGETGIFYTNTGTKLGIGVSLPIIELDVNGGAQINNGLRVGESLYIGPADNYGLINYTAGTAGSPAVFSFGGGGTANPNNPNPGNAYNSYSGGHGGGVNDPPADLTCINGAVPSINLFQNLLCVQKVTTPLPPIQPTSLGNINIGHDGINAFIETQGTNVNSPNAGDLFINSRCNRNVYLFSNGSSFAPTTNHVMSVAGQMNVALNMQIGGGTFLTNFYNNNAKLYVYANSTTGIQVRHGLGIAALHTIELADNSKGIAVYRGTATTDGSERFSVQGDGKTAITTSNVQAMAVKNSNNTFECFSLYSDGQTIINTTSTDAFLVIDQANNKINFKVKKTGYVYAREINVLPTTLVFPDYVFEKNYPLLSITEVEKYIAKNKHLPNIPTAKEINIEGINMGEMLTKQMEKIEEAFLYIIQLKKENDELKKRLENLETSK